MAMYLRIRCQKMFHLQKFTSVQKKSCWWLHKVKILKLSFKGNFSQHGGLKTIQGPFYPGTRCIVRFQATRLPANRLQSRRNCLPFSSSLHHVTYASCALWRTSGYREQFSCWSVKQSVEWANSSEIYVSNKYAYILPITEKKQHTWYLLFHYILI